ncbi:MAG TPA: PTS sugar transporter subunit IIC [Erysipelotrichaceae bacterium]|nr:PTS sugar transporter subunit IIC [Erysipelotrichaceae bacterium]
MGDFNFLQIALVLVVTFIAAIDQFSFLESLYQPIVMGPVVGAILGDLQTGLAVGGTYQLIQIGSMPVGGAQPPNAVIGGIMATILAVTIGGEAQVAVGLAVPFALFGQYAVTTTFALMSPLMARADKAAEEANPQGITNINILGMGIIGLLFTVIIALGFIVGAQLADILVSISYNMSWLMAGLSVAGGMMRYVGFAVLMKMMLAGDLWAYFGLGFAFATIVGAIPSLGGSALIILALIGFAFAIQDFMVNTKIARLGTVGGDTDGI